MTKRERRTYFERLCALREAYQHLDAGDQPTSTTLTEAMAAVQHELELMAEAAEGLPAEDPTSTQHPV